MADFISFIVDLQNKGAIKNIQDLIDRQKQLKRDLQETPNVGSKEFKKLSEEFRRNNKALTEFRRNIRGSKSLMENVANGVTQAFKRVGVALLAAFSARAIGQAVTTAINIFKDFEQAITDVRAITLATDEEFEKLSQEAIRLGGSTKFTASEIAGLQKEFAKLGFTTDEIINATEATSNLAAATGEDLARSAKVAGATVRAFGLDTSETGRVTDVLAASFSKSALDLEKFETAMRAVGPVAKNAGLSIEQTTSLLAQLVDRGVDASTAGTGLRNVFLELSKQGITFEEAMDQINEASDRNAVSLDLFGKRGAVVGTILSETTESANLLTAELNNSGGTAKQIADIQLQTLEGRLTLLKSAFDGFVLSIIEGDGALVGFLKSVVDAGASILKYFQATEEATESNIELLQTNIDQTRELQSLADEYDTLSEKVDQTEEDKARLKDITLELRDAFGDSVVEINNETGALEVNRKAVLENLRQRLALEDDEIRKQVLRRANVEVQLEQIQNEIDLQQKLVEVAKEREGQQDIIDAKNDEGILKQNEINLDRLADIKAEEIAEKSLFQLQQEAEQQLFEDKERTATAQEKLNELTFEASALGAEKAVIDKLLTDNGVDFEKVLSETNKAVDINTNATESNTESKKKNAKATSKQDKELKAFLKSQKEEFEALQKTTDANIKTAEELEKTRDKIREAGAKTLEEQQKEETKTLERELNSRLINIELGTLAEGNIRETFRLKQLQLDEEFRKKIEERDKDDALKKREQQQADFETSIGAVQQTLDAVAEFQAVARERRLEETRLQFEDELLELDNRNQRELINFRGTEEEKTKLLAKQELERNKLEEAQRRREDQIRQETLRREKTVAISQAVIRGALAIQRIAADVPKVDFGVSTALLIGAQIATTAAQVATIQGQQFEKGGLIEFAEGGPIAFPARNGGMIRGPRHSGGGVKFMARGGMAEAEGGEFIVNRKATAAFYPIIDFLNNVGNKMSMANVPMLKPTTPIFQDGGLITGGTFAGSGTIEGQLSQLIRATKSRKVVLSLTELEDAQSELDILESNAEL